MAELTRQISSGNQETVKVSEAGIQAISMLDLVMYDHDGVVVINSEDLAQDGSLEVLEKVLKPHNIPLPARDEYIREAAGRVFTDTLQVYAHRLPQLKLTPQRILELDRAELGAVINRLREGAEPTPHLFDTLDILERAQVPAAVVSSSVRERIDVGHRRIGADPYFPRNRVFSGQSDFLPQKFPKPKPDVYIRAMEVVGHELQKDLRQLKGVIAIEDSTSGVQSAVRAGVPWVIGFVGGTHIPSHEKHNKACDLIKAGAFTVVDSMEQLPSVWVQIGTIIALNRHLRDMTPRNFAETVVKAMHLNERFRYMPVTIRDHAAKDPAVVATSVDQIK